MADLSTRLLSADIPAHEFYWGAVLFANGEITRTQFEDGLAQVSQTGDALDAGAQAQIDDIVTAFGALSATGQVAYMTSLDSVTGLLQAVVPGVDEAKWKSVLGVT